MDIFDLKPSKLSKYINRKCNDEVIGTIQKENGKIKFKYRDDYEEQFVPLESHDAYFKYRDVNIVKKVSILLESPHKNEFFNPSISIFNNEDKKSKKETQSRPANGVTGKNIMKYLSEIIKQMLEEKIGEDIYSVSLVNAVQYQCSLGYSPLYFRDRLWIRFWIDGANKELMKRLKKFSADYIINSCTKGSRYEIDSHGKEYLLLVKKDYITFKFLKEEFGLVKTATHSEKVKLEVNPDSAKKLSLQGIVEAELFRSNMIDSSNYFTIAHPSSWGRKKLPEIKSLDNNIKPISFI